MDGRIIVQFILQIRRSHWWAAQLAVLFYIRGFAPARPLWHKPSKKDSGQDHMSGSARANERWGRSLSGQGGFCSFRKGAGLNQSVATVVSRNIKWIFESQKASEQQTQTTNITPTRLITWIN